MIVNKLKIVMNLEKQGFLVDINTVFKFYPQGYPQIEDNLCKQRVIHIFYKNNKKIYLQDIEIKKFLPYIYSGFCCKSCKKVRKHQCL